MAQPYFSIVLPIYGVEKYLDRCINSILDQDFSDFEIVLVDDESPDRCPQMCDSWAEKETRIKVVHKKNAGLGMARNTGMDHAEGKYILFVDSDDYIYPGLLSRCYGIIEETHCDGVFYGYARVDENQELIQDFKPQVEPRLYKREEDQIASDLLSDFLGRNPRTGVTKNLRISVCTCALNLEMLKRNKLRFVSEREYISEDTYFYLSLFPCFESIYLLNETYYCYCQNEGSLTFSYKPDRFERQRKFYIDSVKKARKEGLSKGVEERLTVPFISNVMSTLKMEIGNVKQAGLMRTYRNIKNICDDRVFHHVVKNYPSKHLPKAWKAFFACIRCKQYLLLSLILYIQFNLKKV